MAFVLDCALLLTFALVSSALKVVSQTIRFSAVIHKIVKKLDRGKVGGLDFFFENSYILRSIYEHYIILYLVLVLVYQGIQVLET